MLHHGRIIGERDGLRVLDCSDCGYAHLETMPGAAELDSYYASDFWQKEKAGELDRYLEQREWLAMRHGDWLILLAQHTPEMSLLDVGCGYGFFLQDAEAASWEVGGIEPSNKAARYAQSILPMDTLHKIGWNDYVGMGWGALSAMWMIEHLLAPLEFLRWAHSRLLPGGVLLLTVPNDFSQAQNEINHRVNRPFWYIHSTHLNYFTPSSIANLLGLAGFQIIERQATFQMEEYLMTDDYTVDDSIGRSVHKRVRDLELSVVRQTRLELYGRNGAMGYGRDLVLIAKAV
jgi:2-polyprenyl-3-methyl-5-hydroxy-6-metoxy-1,4-benzoquinol methylase